MTTPVPRPNLAAYVARMKSRRAWVRAARQALEEHRAACTACALWWEPCAAGIALMKAETAAIDALDLERGRWSEPATTDKEIR